MGFSGTAREIRARTDVDLVNMALFLPN